MCQKMARSLLTDQLHGANFFLTILTVASLGKKLPTSSDTPWLVMALHPF
jgi:hypothetical protein